MIGGPDKKIKVKPYKEDDEERKENGHKEVYINYSDSISDVKAKVQDITGIPYYQQILSYKDQKVDDKKTLSEYNIKVDSDPVLCLKTKLLVSVKESTGKIWCFPLEKIAKS